MKELKANLNEPNTQVYAPLLVSDKIYEMAIEKFKGRTVLDGSYCVDDWEALIFWINDGLQNDGYIFYGMVYQSQLNISKRGL